MPDPDGPNVVASDGVPAQIAALTQRLDEMLREVQGQREELSRLTRAYAIDAQQLDRLRVVSELWKVHAIQAHIREVVRAAPVLTDPFPHLIIEPLLPPDAFNVLMEAIPADDFFDGDKHLDIRGIGLSSCILPLFSKVIWRSLRREVVGEVLGPAVAERFRPFAREFLRVSVGEEFVDEALALPLYPHGLRLMLRRPGWRLPPHLDPRDQFISTLLYLARPEEPETYGTQLFRVDQENFVAGCANTYFPEGDGLRCELAKTLPYRGNLCLSFLNLGGGAHGAAVPADAQPADLRRLVFQFYMGPEPEVLAALVDRLPAERQIAWTRKVKGKGRVKSKDRLTMPEAAQG